MYYKVEFYLESFQAWSGGKDTLTNLNYEQIKIVEQWIIDIYSGGDTIPTETEINNILWLQSDAIYELLGLDENGEEIEEEEEEEEEEDL